MEPQHQGQYHHGGPDGRGDERSRMPEQYPPQHQQLPQQLPTQTSYSAQAGPSSPPPTSSPFAFAPPPLSSHPAQPSSRPMLPLHHSEPPPHHPQYQQYSPKPPLVPHHHSFPTYPGSAPMGHRSFSNEAPRQSPTQAHMARPTQNAGPPNFSSPGQSSNAASEHSYAYARHLSFPSPAPPPQAPIAHHIQPQQPQQQQQPPRAAMYSPSVNYSGQHAPPQPGAADMPRSVSYPVNAYPPHHPYQPIYAHHPHSGMVHPAAPAGYQHYQQAGPPPMNRSDTTASISNGLAGVDLNRPIQFVPVGPGHIYSNRQLVIDRPYRCDECVQSFNRNHDLKRHKRIHLSVKPFGCGKCGKTFSRKDALRRHWMVKGCRGEEGATAPIFPLFPINSTPALSPRTPTIELSPSEPSSSSQTYPVSSQGFNHPSAPPPLSSLPSRQPSTHSQILITPNDPAAQLPDRHIAVAPPMDEPTGVVDPLASVSMQNGHDIADSSGDGYFDGVVGLKSDGTAVIDKSQDSPVNFVTTSHPTQQPHFHHPYRRVSNFSSPHQHPSPSTVPHQLRPYTPSSLGGDGKPVFAMPFARPEFSHLQSEGMLVPQVVEMEKQSSQMSHASEVEYQAAPRWHRPSFPFPPTNNVYSQSYDPEMVAASQPIPTQGYGQ